MFDWDKWQEIFSTLRHNKLRTVLTAAGVFWGIFMLVLMLGFGNGLQAGVTKNMFGFITNSVYIWGQRTSKPYQGIPERRWVALKNTDTEAIRREVGGIRALAPRIELGGWRQGNNVTYRDRVGNFGVRGDVPELAEVESIRPYLGRFINELDVRELRKTTVIGEQVRNVLFGADVDPVGQYLEIRGIQFQVIGVFRSQLPGDEGERINSTLHIPLSTLQRTFNATNRVGWFAVLVQDDVSAERVQVDIARVLRARHGIHPEDEHALGSYNAGKQFQRVENLFMGIRAFIWFVSIATLGAGALGVSNIMLISIRERTKEIGVRKALGATPWSIVSLVMQETALLTTLAGYSGLVTGVLTLELCSRTLAQGSGPLGEPSIPLHVALLATAVLGVVGVVAGLAPAHRAAQIQPVVALRSE